MGLLKKDEGFILRTVKFGETSLIADILTENDGLRSFVIRGARKQKSSFSPAAIQLMAPVSIDYYTKEKSGLNQLKELRLNYFWESIPQQFPKRAIGIFICEVTRKSIEKFQPNPEIFQLLKNTIQQLDLLEQYQNLHLWYLVQLANEMGYGMQLESDLELPYFDLMEGKLTHFAPIHGHFIEGNILNSLINLNNLTIANIAQLKLINQNRRLLLETLIEYHRLHQHGIFQIQSLAILKDIFL